MSSISSISNSHVNTAQSASSVAKTNPGKFEINSNNYGPTVATAISAADALGNAASAVYNFSEKSLQELAKLPGEAYDTAKGAVEAVGHAVGDAVDAVEEGVETVAKDAASVVSAGIRKVENAYDSIEHMASSASKSLGSGLTAASKAYDSVEDVVTSAAKEVGTAATTVAGYTALGLGSVASKISDLV